MDLYCVLGNPVAHSQSPRIHARFAELTGHTLAYERRLVPLDGFLDGVRAFRAEGGRGCNVTVPFKFEAAALAGGALTPRAALAGACNVLRFDGDAITGDTITGDNSDGIGLVRDITVNAGVPLAGARILLVGAGGAAAGVLGPLLEAGPAAIDVANRTAANAQVLVRRHAPVAARLGIVLRACGLGEAASGYDVVVNASATSLSGSAVPVASTVLRPGTLACDLMYGAAAQGFLAWARTHGAVPRDGLGMLVEQAAEAYRYWRGVRPPSAPVLDELRRELPLAA